MTTNSASTDTRDEDGGALSMLLTSDKSNDFANAGLPLRISSIGVGFGDVGGYKSPVQMQILTSPYRAGDDFEL